jgi:hypothetical protein
VAVFLLMIVAWQTSRPSIESIAYQRGTMNRIEVSAVIAAPVERVFEVFSDLRTAPQRIKGIVNLEVLTDGPVGTGTKFRETRIMMGHKATETMTITEFTPPTGYTVEAHSCGCHYRTRFDFLPVAGGTQVNGVFSGKPETFLAKCMLFVMKPMMKKMERACRDALHGDMSDLKSAIEARAE